MNIWLTLTNSQILLQPSSQQHFHLLQVVKLSLTSKIVEDEDLTIYGNVGNVTIDINGGATAKEIAAAITARKGETGVYADAQTRMNMTFSEVLLRPQIQFHLTFMGRMTLPCLLLQM